MEMLLRIDKEAELPKFYKNTLMEIIQKDKHSFTVSSKRK